MSRPDGTQPDGSGDTAERDLPDGSGDTASGARRTAQTAGRTARTPRTGQAARHLPGARMPPVRRTSPGPTAPRSLTARCRVRPRAAPTGRRVRVPPGLRQARQARRPADASPFRGAGPATPRPIRSPSGAAPNPASPIRQRRTTVASARIPSAGGQARPVPRSRGRRPPARCLPPRPPPVRRRRLRPGSPAPSAHRRGPRRRCLAHSEGLGPLDRSRRRRGPGGPAGTAAPRRRPVHRPPAAASQATAAVRAGGAWSTCCRAGCSTRGRAPPTFGAASSPLGSTSPCWAATRSRC